MVSAQWSDRDTSRRLTQRPKPFLLPCQTVRLQTSGHPVYSLNAAVAQKMRGQVADAV
jgi:hypothetical protein